MKPTHFNLRSRGKNGRMLQQALGLALILLLLAGCGGETTAEPTPTPMPTQAPIVTGIEGRVYYAGSDRPIPDVTILLNNPYLTGGPFQQDPALTICEATTDANGAYAFLDIVPGTYVVTFTFTTDTPVSSIDVTKSENISRFELPIPNSDLIFYATEPIITVAAGELVQEDFIVNE
ncbi:MAG: carboxypeptidase regulatory-like domain-containing protein [Anaerolineales bacterium]|nr:carboxypeptidase regulatory-like domain-containing protein [Anaerolineales bacterium]